MMTAQRRAGSILAMLACLLLGASIVTFGALPAFVAPTVLGVMGLVGLVRWLTGWSDDVEAPDRVSRWTMGSFGIHLLFGSVVTASAAATAYLATDSVTYDSVARGILAHWQKGLPMPELGGGKEGYYYLLAGLYWLFGPHKVAGLVVNAALAAALVPIVADTTHRLFGARAARYAAAVTVVVPGMVVWPSTLLKEAPILFLLAVAANCGVRLLDRVTLGPLVLLMATLPALLSFRGPVGLAVLGGIVAGMALGKRDIAGGLAAAGAVAGLVAVMVALGLGSSGYRYTVRSDLRQVNLVRQDLSESASSGFAPSADISTPKGAISYLPRGVLGFTLGPFPWEIRGTRQLIAVPDLLAWYFLVPCLWRGSRAAVRLSGRRLLVVVLPAVAITLLLSLLIGNYGTIVRERMQILVLLVPLMALGLAQRRSSSMQPAEAEAQLVA